MITSIKHCVVEMFFQPLSVLIMVVDKILQRNSLRQRCLMSLIFSMISKCLTGLGFTKEMSVNGSNLIAFHVWFWSQNGKTGKKTIIQLLNYLSVLSILIKWKLSAISTDRRLFIKLWELRAISVSDQILNLDTKNIM